MDRRQFLSRGAALGLLPVLSTRPFTNYAHNLPRVVQFGDSITYGVGSTLSAGYRELLWRMAAANGVSYACAGTQVFSGSDNTFVEFPACEGYPGITAANLIPKLAPMAAFFTDAVTFAGGTNDIAAGADAATVAATISSALDQIWALRQSDRLQIGLFTLLQRIDSFDPVVVSTNALLPGVLSGKSYVANLTLIDIWGSCTVSTDFFNGTVHPNDVGCPKVAAAAYPAFASMITKARLV